MERLPGQDDKLCIDEDDGTVALLEAGRPLRWRVKAGLVTAAAALGLASLALATAPWHRGAAIVGGDPQRQGQEGTKLFHSLNNYPVDQGTMLTQAVEKGESQLYVHNTNIFAVGDDIVVVDTAGDASLNEEAVVKSVEEDKVILESPVSQSLRQFSYIIVPTDPKSDTGSQYNVDTVSEGTAPGGDTSSVGGTASVGGTGPVGSTAEVGPVGGTGPVGSSGGAPSSDRTALKVFLGLFLFLLSALLLFLCIFCVGKYWGTAAGAPRKAGHWIYKPTDGSAVYALASPSFAAQETNNVMNRGDFMKVIDKQDGAGDGLFLKLADGQGWVYDREPGNDMCYELFTAVDEPWLYDPVKSGGRMPILKMPDIAGQRTGQRLQPGDKFRVSEIQAFPGSMVLFLKLADGRGWVYDQHVDDGELLCRRIVEETWVYQPANGLDVMVRKYPDLDAEKTHHQVPPGTRFEVDEVVIGDREQNLLFLKLADGRGWLFNKHPEVGALCDRVY